MSKRKNDGSYGEDSSLVAPEGETNAEAPINAPDPAGDAGASLVGTAAIVPTQQDAEAAAAQTESGIVPMAAPKAGEGQNLAAREVEHPELEAPVAPAELRVAPAAPDQFEREEFEGRPSLEEIEKAQAVIVQTVDKQSGGIVVGGVVVTREPQEVIVQTLLNRTRQHLLAVATDPRIQVKIA